MRHDRPARLLAIPLLALAVAASVPAARAASGTDLGFGYTWRDRPSGATYQVLIFDPVNDVYQDVQIPADTVIGPITLGLTQPFPFYGATYTQIWISDNGWISFVDPMASSHPVPSPIPDAAGPPTVLAPFWTDLQVDQAGQFIRHGRVSAQDAYRIQFTGAAAAGGAVSWEVLLFSDGRIKFQYSRALTITDQTIGIENQAATDGIEIAAGGVVEAGVAITNSYVIEFLPRSILTDNCGTYPAITCGMTNGNAPAPRPNVQYYACSNTRWAAQEAVYNLTLTSPSRVTVTLTAATGLTTFLLPHCTEHSCIRGPATSYTVNLGSGTYTITVDGASAADQGPFTLDVQCTPLGPAINCGDTVNGMTSGSGTFSPWPCAPMRNLSGAETFYELVIAAPTNIRATLSNTSVDMDVLILRPSIGGEISTASCIAWGDDAAIAWNASPGRYLIVVDGLDRLSGTYTLDVECRIDMDCSVLAGVVDFTTGRVQQITGDNGGAGRVPTYSCNETVSYAMGGEDVWRLDLAQPGQVAVYGLEATGQEYFILSACNEGTCQMSATGCGATLSPGTYYIVIDSQMPGSPYEALVIYEEVFLPWRFCQNAVAPTMPTDTSNTEWHFDDGAFCHSDPTSINYPDGCTFAMYLTASCGSSLHLPMFDVEGLHLRVFDVFRGEYVVLTATSPGGLFMQGTDIDWSERDCMGINPFWNETTVDIFFDRPEGLCGIFRLEFINHSGFIWDLYSNCSGDPTPGFSIHDTLCHALEAFTPLPNVTIISATATYDCPEITVTYTLRNDGCAPAENFPVQVLDNFVVVGTDTIPMLLPGESTHVFTMTFPMIPTSGVSLAVDDGNDVVECTEVPGSGCDVMTGVERVPLADCSGMCQVVSQAVGTPAVICQGDSLTIDASTSFWSLCPTNMLEYQLRGPDTRPWQSSAIFTNVAPTADAVFNVDVRCSDPALSATCVDTSVVNVGVDLRPLFDPAPVLARDLAPCNQGILVTWSAATFRGSLGTGTYSVYRSTVSCADARTQTPLASCLRTTSYIDSATTGGATYYYVVEAEDDDPNSACLPQGPCVRGATTRVDANGGTCVGIVEQVDPDVSILPQVGDTLRAGGSDTMGNTFYDEDFVEFRWGSNRPPDVTAGEHFHVVRSDVPHSGFAAITDDMPRLSLATFTDNDAAQANDATRVFFYLVVSADACENETQRLPSLGGRTR